MLDLLTDLLVLGLTCRGRFASKPRDRSPPPLYSPASLLLLLSLLHRHKQSVVPRWHLKDTILGSQILTRTLGPGAIYRRPSRHTLSQPMAACNRTATPSPSISLHLLSSSQTMAKSRGSELPSRRHVFRWPQRNQAKRILQRWRGSFRACKAQMERHYLCDPLLRPIFRFQCVASGSFQSLVVTKTYGGC